MVGVREAVRLRAQLRDERPLLEREHGVGRTRRGQVRPRSPPSPSHRRRACDPRSGDPEPDSCGRRDAPNERGAAVERCPDLEMRRRAARSASRRRGMRREDRHRGSTTCDDRPGRPVERPAGVASTPACARTSIVCAEPSTRSSSAPRGRTPCGGTCGSPRRSRSSREDANGAPRDRRLGEVEVERQLRRGRDRCTAPAVWNSAEISASRSHRRSGAIAASSARTSSASVRRASQRVAFERQEPSLQPDARRSVRPDPVRLATPRRRGGTGRRARGGCAAQKLPAARAARGRPASAASSP